MPRVRTLDIRYYSNIILLNYEYARKHGIDPETRALIVRGKEKIIAATPLLTNDIVNPDEVGIPRDLAKVLPLSENEEVEVHPLSQTPSLSALSKKSKGDKLTEAEIHRLVEDIVTGVLDDAGLAMFLALQEAIGMDDNELYHLIKSMVDTGNKIEFDFPVYDEHSIGGVPGNSKVAMIAVPTAIALGLRVPKTSSRAITSPSGTADTMEVLAKVSLEPEEIKRAVLNAGGTLAWTGNLNLAPADDILVRVERRLMIDPPSQVVASILSKKVALGINGLVLDLPVGPGTKLSNTMEAEQLAARFLAQANKYGIRFRALVTFGGEPIGYSIGPALEAKEALQTMMERKGSQSLVDKAMALAGALYELAGKAEVGEGASFARKAFQEGKTYEVFKKMLEAQQGNPEVKPEDIELGNYSETIYTMKTGAITFIDNKALNLIARVAGAPHDKKAGIRLHAKIGYRVKQGDPLYTIYSSSASRLEDALKLARSLREIEVGTMILKTIP